MKRNVKAEDEQKYQTAVCHVWKCWFSTLLIINEYILLKAAFTLLYTLF